HRRGDRLEPIADCRVLDICQAAKESDVHVESLVGGIRDEVDAPAEALTEVARQEPVEPAQMRGQAAGDAQRASPAGSAKADPPVSPDVVPQGVLRRQAA